MWKILSKLRAHYINSNDFLCDQEHGASQTVLQVLSSKVFYLKSPPASSPYMIHAYTQEQDTCRCGHVKPPMAFATEGTWEKILTLATKQSATKLTTGLVLILLAPHNSHWVDSF